MPTMTQQTHDQIEINKQSIVLVSNSKVDKISGKELSEEDFTTALKHKLDTIEGSHFKGTHATLAALEIAFPASLQEAGSYAYIQTGTDPLKMAMLDDTGDAWKDLDAGHTDLTSAQVKALYESNANTNPFDDNIKNLLATFLPSADEAILKGHVPAIVLDVENGGVASTLETTYNNGTTTHAVSTIQWVKASQEADWTLSDKDTGVIKAMFQMKPNGTFHIGNGMTQHQVATLDDLQAFDILDYNGVDLDNILSKGFHYVDGINKPPHTSTGLLEVKEYVAGGQLLQTFYADDNFKSFNRVHDGNGWSEWKEDDVAHVIGLMMSMIIGKASKTSLPTIYSGDTIPLDSLGKDLDWYHHFETGSLISKVLYNSAARENYHPNLFALAADYLGDIAQNDIVNIEIAPTNHVVFIELENNATLPIEDLTIEIINYGDAPVDIPIVVLSNAAGEFMGTYSTSYDPVIAKIVGVGGTNPSSFKIKATEGVTTNKEYDYQKHNGTWLRTDFLDIEQINELIRSYHTIVVMSLVDDKKPTRAEAITAFKTLPHFDWAKNDTFYIRDNSGAKTMFCTYFADGATDEASAGPFFFKDMNECV